MVSLSNHEDVAIPIRSPYNLTMAQARDDKQPELPLPRRNRSEPIAREAGKVGDAALARAGFRDPALVLRWNEIAGAEVARLARPLRLSQTQSGGTLTVMAEPGASVFLQHETRVLCERINTFLGYPAVSKLRFVQGALTAKSIHNLPPKPAAALRPGDPALRYQGPESLREALLNLARVRSSRATRHGN